MSSAGDSYRVPGRRWEGKELKTTFRDLADSAQDIAILTSFYCTLFVEEFPDPDERESLENMIDYLTLRREGWYGRNNYHILLAMADGEPVGGSVVDYLAEPNVGVIEFLLIAPNARQYGIGRQLLERTEQLLDEDARRESGAPLSAVIAEMNDPLAPSDVNDNMDPTKRALIWHHWGYSGLDFPYLQPALSDDQDPVTNLILIAKPFRADWLAGLPSATVRLAVHEYLRWAMRIPDPTGCAEYLTMATHLAGRTTVPTLPLAAYVGRDPEKPLHTKEITSPTEPDFEPTMACYRTALGTGPLTVAESDFATALAETASYHLWSIRGQEQDGPVEGMTSFFSLATAGFAGYIAFTGALRGSGRLRRLVARIEDRMLRDRPAIRGWYIEVGDDTDAGPFLAVGFRELKIDYHQPRPDGPAVPVRLMYKPFGRDYGSNRPSDAEIRTAVDEILTTVYRVVAP